MFMLIFYFIVLNINTYNHIIGTRCLCNEFIHSSDILSIRFKHTRIIRFFGLLKKYLKILDTKANFQAFVFL